MKSRNLAALTLTLALGVGVPVAPVAGASAKAAPVGLTAVPSGVGQSSVARARTPHPTLTRVWMRRPSGADRVLSRTDRSRLAAERRTAGEAAPSAALAVVSRSPVTAVPADVTVAGVTFDRAPSPDAVVQYRSRSAGAWSAWQSVEVDTSTEHGPDAGTAEARSARPGTDPIALVGTDGVEVRVLGSASDTAAATARLDVIDPDDTSAPARTAASSPPSAPSAPAPSPTSSQPSAPAPSPTSSQPSAPAPVAPAPPPTSSQPSAPAPVAPEPTTTTAANAPVPSALVATTTTTTVSRPVILTRAQWGADESIRGWAPRYGAVKGMFVHHTVNSNTYTADQVPALIRGIYVFHVKSRGWGDIGYNFLIDRFGRIWEGRYGGMDKAVVGAHTLGHNSVSFGVATIGTFDTVSAPASVISAYARLLAWKARMHGIDLSSPLVSYAGDVKRTVSGHRDGAGNSTECPGNRLYAQIPTIYAKAKALVAGLPSLTVNRDVDNFGDNDLIGRSPDGHLALWWGTGSRTTEGGKVIGHGWNGFDAVMTPGSWDASPAADLLARRADTGALWLYPGNGQGGFSAARSIGHGWGTLDLVVPVGDFDGDGHPDLIARVVSDQSLRLYSGNGSGGFARTATIGSRWGAFDSLVGVGDWSGDGHPDLLGVRANGQVQVYLGSGKGRFNGTRITLERPLPDHASATAAGDVDHNGRVDLMVVRRDGSAEMWLGTGTPTRPTVVTTALDLQGYQLFSG